MSLNKKVMTRLEKGAVATITREDGKAFTGKVVVLDSGILSIRTGKRGRPGTMRKEQVSAVTFAETVKAAPKPRAAAKPKTVSLVKETPAEAPALQDA